MGVIEKNYKDFEELYFGINQDILLYPEKYLSYIVNTRGIVNDLMLHVESTKCGRIDLAKLGYAKQKWTHLVRTYLSEKDLNAFFKNCEISKGVSIAFDFKRKGTGNGSCMREIILTRTKGKGGLWEEARIIWRATELQKRFAADLMLIHHLVKAIPKANIKKVSLYIASGYQSAMYVVPLVQPLFNVTLSKLDPTKHRYWNVLRKCEAKYYQEDSKPYKLAFARRMQLQDMDFKGGVEKPPLLVDNFSLENTIQ